MKSKKTLLIFILLTLFFSIEVSYTTKGSADNSQERVAGINGKTIQQGAKAVKSAWKALKGCIRSEEKIAIKPLKPRILPASDIKIASEMLTKGLNNIKSADEILPQIEKYLSTTQRNSNAPKVIECIKTDADKVRIYLYENNALKLNRYIKGINESIKLSEYDIRSMQEKIHTGADGIEYVSFIIPKLPQYVLNRQFEGRIYECMVFNLPKDNNGNWEKFKEYLLALWNDLVNRPELLWDEFQFRRDLAKLNICSSDLKEIKTYLFAQIIKDCHEYSQSIQKKIA